MPQCPSCGTFGEGKFCGTCGQPLTAALAQQPPTPPQPHQPSPTQTQQPPEMPPQQQQPVPAYVSEPPTAPVTATVAPEPTPAQTAPPANAPAQPAHGQAYDTPPGYPQPPAEQAPATTAQPHQWQQTGQAPPEGAYAPQPYIGPYGGQQDQRTASAYYIALAALVFAVLGGLLGLFLAALGQWLGKKQLAQGRPKAQQAINISNIAFPIALVFTMIYWVIW